MRVADPTVTDRLSDVASGETHRPGGIQPSTRTGGVKLALPHEAFFQVNTEGGKLFETISEALGDGHDATLLDLYCGVGATGMIVGRAHRSILGVDRRVCCRDRA